MQFNLSTLSATDIQTDCLILPVFQKTQEEKYSHTLISLDQALQQMISRVMEQGDFTAAHDTTLLLPAINGIKAQRLLLLGMGEITALNAMKCGQAIHTALKVVLKQGMLKSSALLLDEIPDVLQYLGVIIENIGHATYQFAAPKRDFKSITLVNFEMVTAQKEQAQIILTRAQAVVKGMNLAKDLGNQAPNLMNPSELAATAQRLSQQYHTIKCTVLETKQMQSLGMNALLAVARGSIQEPKFIVLEYNQASANSAPIVLVGKGVTFDSGGISIKPSEAMDEMKYDMCGAASVLGTFQAIAEMALNVHVIGLIPAVENMPSGSATRPGDVITSMSGQTIEVLNTDAEGRLILCDALTYAERYQPRAVIDIATLTGAIIIALGNVASGLFTNDEKLAQVLKQCAEKTGDRVWEFPIWEEYQTGLASNFADMANIGTRAGGSITAACFLSRFAKQYPWAHLDIAGTAWKSGKEKGATGRPIALLIEYLHQSIA